MAMLDFTFEFQSEIDEPTEGLRDEAERRLRSLGEGHQDLIGAMVTLEELTGGTTPHRYEATVVVYKRPENLAATEKAETARGALKGALSALERQVREMREKRRETWKRPGSRGPEAPGS